jgi:hypothetical protein
MLTQDDINSLDYQWKRLAYASAEFDRLHDGECFSHLKHEFKDAKYIYESHTDKAEGVEWFHKRLSKINEGLKKIEDIESRNTPVQVSSENCIELKKPETTSQEVFAYSERAMNKTIVPISKAIREIRFPVELEIKGEKYSTTNCWEARHFMAMDALAYLILKKLGFPRKAQTIFDSVEEIEKRAELLKSEDIATEHKLEENLVSSFKNTKYWVKCDAEFFREFTGKQLETQQITDLLTETACKFTFSYPVLLKDKNKKLTENKYRVSVHTSFFTLAYIDALDKNDKTKKRTFYAFFNTGLGECFVNNLLAKGYDMFDTKRFYSLPSLSQMFFRKFILHHSHFGPIHKPLKEIRKGLNLTIKGDTDLIAYLKQKVFDPLEKKGGISDYEVKKELGEWWIFFQRSDRKYQVHQQQLKAPERKKMESKDKKLKSKQMQSDEMVEVNGVKKWPEETDEY